MLSLVIIGSIDNDLVSRLHKPHASEPVSRNVLGGPLPFQARVELTWTSSGYPSTIIITRKVTVAF